MKIKIIIKIIIIIKIKIKIKIKILSYTFIRIRNFLKNLKKLEKNDFFEKSQKTKKIHFLVFFQDFQNSSSIF